MKTSFFLGTFSILAIAFFGFYVFSALADTINCEGAQVCVAPDPNNPNTPACGFGGTFTCSCPNPQIASCNTGAQVSCGLSDIWGNFTCRSSDTCSCSEPPPPAINSCSLFFDKSTYCVTPTTTAPYSWSVASNPSGFAAYLHGTKNGSTDASDVFIGNTNLFFSGTFNINSVGTYGRWAHIQSGDNHLACQTSQTTISIADCSSPTVGISANPMSVAYGGSADVIWSSGNATSCSVEKNGTQFSTAFSGSQIFSNLISNTKFEITCFNNYDPKTASVIVSVSAPPPVCSPSSQTVNVDQNTNFFSTGGDGVYSWSAPGAFTSSGSGPAFSTGWSISGAKTVTVTSAGQNSNCGVDVKPNAIITSISPPGEFIWWLPRLLNSNFNQRAYVDLNGNSQVFNGAARFKAIPRGAGETYVCEYIEFNAETGEFTAEGVAGRYNHRYEGDFYTGWTISDLACNLIPVTTRQDIGAEEKTYTPFWGLWDLYDLKQGKIVSDHLSFLGVRTKFAYPSGAEAKVSSVSVNKIKVALSAGNYNPARGVSQAGRDYLDYYYRFIDGSAAASAWNGPISTGSRASLPSKFTVESTFTCKNDRKVEFQVKNRYNHVETPSSSLSNSVDLSCTGIGILPSVNLKANNSDGPLTLDHKSLVNLSWTSANVSSCTASGDWSGTKSISSTESMGNLSGPRIYSYKLDCAGDAGPASDLATVNINEPTLSVFSFTADPSSGNSPLKTDLTATVSGTAVGTINYSFWYNCSYAGTSVSTAINQCGNPDKKFDGSNKTTEKINVTYSKVGEYIAKVIVERDTAAPAEKRATISVLNNKPAVSNVTVREPNYCFTGPAATTEWTFSDPDGNLQSAYQVQIDDQGSFNSPEHDTGKVACVDCRSNNSGPGKLQFNATYNVHVRAWDSNDLASSWADMAILCDSTGSCKSAGNWKTPKHTYPTTAVDLFTWTPPEPAANEEIKFSDKTKCFNDKNQQVSCESWGWTFGDGRLSTLQNPRHTYNNTGAYTATETVTDKDRLSCSASQTINITEKIPIFKEIRPKQ